MGVAAATRTFGCMFQVSGNEYRAQAGLGAEEETE